MFLVLAKRAAKLTHFFESANYFSEFSTQNLKAKFQYYQRLTNPAQNSQASFSTMNTVAELLYLCLMKKFLIAFLTLLSLCLSVPAQDVTPVPDSLEYYDEITPSVVTGRRRKKIKHYGREWRQQYRLIWNFNKIYPYALVGRNLMRQVDSTIATGSLDGRERDKYIKEVEKELLRLFEKDIRQMTISQGFLLVRLVDRECGTTVYDIIKNYEGSVAAGFWNLVGKMFEQDLKSHYDPEGKDAKTEQLIEIWESGDWDNFFFSIFGEEPQKTVIGTEHLSTQPKSKRK